MKALAVVACGSATPAGGSGPTFGGDGGVNAIPPIA
jgi:hypothetical protein